METKHTPGPWRWLTPNGGIALVGDHGRRPAVLTARSAQVRQGARLIPFDVTHPDALLIKAAPDLLEALVTLRDVSHRNVPSDDEGFREWVAESKAAWGRADAAIAKAKPTRGEG